MGTPTPAGVNLTPGLRSAVSIVFGVQLVRMPAGDGLQFYKATQEPNWALAFF